MTKQLLVGVALALALCSMMAHALLRCENFDTYIAGTVYSNVTGFPPGRYISQSPVRFDGQKFFGDPAGRYYGSLYIAAASNVSSFFTSPSVSGSVLDIRDMTIEFDFRNMARSDQPKYIRFEFYDFGTLQNLRVNNGTVYKGSLVSIEEAVNSNIYWFPKRQRRFVSNLGELFVANNATRMERFWIGGDRLYIDNVCWDTDWHDHPKVDAPSGDVRLLAPALMAAVAGLVSLFLL